MVKINITIENLEITAEQLLALLGKDAEVAVGHADKVCPDCGKTFKSQNSVNSHLKNCRERAPERVAVVKPKKAKPKQAKKQCMNCGGTQTPSWRKAKSPDGPVCNKCYQAEVRKAKKAVKAASKPKKPAKPSYPGLSDKDVMNAVVAVLVSRNKDITTAHLIADQIVSVAEGKFDKDDKLTELKDTILDRVSGAIKRVGLKLGMTECMVVDVNVSGRTGAQIAMFPAKEYSATALAKRVSK